MTAMPSCHEYRPSTLQPDSKSVSVYEDVLQAGDTEPSSTVANNFNYYDNAHKSVSIKEYHTPAIVCGGFCSASSINRTGGPVKKGIVSPFRQATADTSEHVCKCDVCNMKKICDAGKQWSNRSKCMTEVLSCSTHASVSSHSYIRAFQSCMHNEYQSRDKAAMNPQQFSIPGNVAPYFTACEQGGQVSFIDSVYVFSDKWSLR